VIVFKSLNLVFIHAPKTGGSAIASQLFAAEGRISEWTAAYTQGQQKRLHIGHKQHSWPTEPMDMPSLVVVRDEGELLNSCYRYNQMRKRHDITPTEFLRRLRDDPRTLSDPVSHYVNANGFEAYTKHADKVLEYEGITIQHKVNQSIGDGLNDEQKAEAASMWRSHGWKTQKDCNYLAFNDAKM